MTKAPAKKWRAGKTDAAYAFTAAKSYSSEVKAYAAALELVAAGHAVTVWHYVHPHWQTFEKLDATGQPA